MRILIIASESPPVASGVARSVDRLARGLRQHGHEVDTLSSADGPYLVFREVRLSALGGRLLRLAHEIRVQLCLINYPGDLARPNCDPGSHSAAALSYERMTRTVSSPANLFIPFPEESDDGHQGGFFQGDSESFG